MNDFPYLFTVFQAQNLPVKLTFFLIDGFFYFIPNISEVSFVCWIFVSLMSPVVPLSLLMVNFNAFHPGSWWSGEFFLK